MNEFLVTPAKSPLPFDSCPEDQDMIFILPPEAMGKGVIGKLKRVFGGEDYKIPPKDRVLIETNCGCVLDVTENPPNYWVSLDSVLLNNFTFCSVSGIMNV